ncbi:MAG: SDR family oxidoreductase [Novosphingobium sp.]|nr:SDR family oxidoreductase [Novosphingobium sp.]
MKKTVLILGASGVVGFSALEEFLEDADCTVISVSRRKPSVRSERSFQHHSVDLRDAEATNALFSTMSEVTHVVYAALYEKPGLIEGWSDSEQMSTNLAMIRNLMEPLCAVAKIQHISLLQGTKAYGIHLHPMPIPARESAPRDNHANFYWLQEDYIREKAAYVGFDFTILRPQLIIGAPFGVAMNLAPVIGAYAAICRKLGEPCGFPGGASYVWEAVDARLVAKVLHWATEAENARGQHFNVTNGDVFEWRNLWPAMMDVLGVENGPDRPRSMAEYLPQHSATWDALVAEHGLVDTSIEEIVGESHYYADFCFAYGAESPPLPAFVSTIKLRQAGFHHVFDTEQMFAYWLRYFMDQNVLPAAN